jgi:predicted PurR-regulated permease PerM
MGAILGFITSLFSPATAILNNLHADETQKQQLQAQITKIQADVTEKMVALEMEKVKLQEMESQSTNWLVSSYRPIVYLIVTAIVLLQSFNLCHPAESFWTFAQVILGVGFAGRTYEKAAEINSKKVK